MKSLNRVSTVGINHFYDKVSYLPWSKGAKNCLQLVLNGWLEEESGQYPEIVIQHT